MNLIIKTIAITWLIACALTISVSVAALGFWLIFTNYSFMFSVMPAVWATSAFSIGLLIARVIKSNPKEAFFGKDT